MSKKYIPIFLLVCLIFLLNFLGCSNHTFKDAAPTIGDQKTKQEDISLTPSSSTALLEQNKKEIEAQITIQGSCVIMRPPSPDESQLMPCNKSALQLVYQKNQQLIITVIRTQEDGKFAIVIPKTSPWKLTSATTNWQAEVELLGNHNGSNKVIVILKPEKVLKIIK